ncbi:tyrosine--tRNA ligase [Patescibacteria group bacterium]
MKKTIIDLLTRGVVEVIDKKALTKKLKSGKSLRVKLGVDPTLPTTHFGHMVPLKKLKSFQDLGHKAVFLVGDFTAQIGDPTGRTKAREMLTHQQTKKMAKDYFNQVFKVLDKSKTEIHTQSEWYEKIGMAEVIGLMAKTTKNQLMRHHTFAQREKDGLELGFHEMLYPLLMAFDSVKLKADVELGAIDQKFNFLLTRQVMERFGLVPEDVLLTKYLPGIDGSEKMSKSQHNFIGVAEKPIDQVRKLLGIQDKDIDVFFELLTQSGKAVGKSPFEAKKQLALKVVSQFHSLSSAQKALKEFEQIRKQQGRFVKTKKIIVRGGGQELISLVIKAKGVSKREARRLIVQGGVKVNGKKIRSSDMKVQVKNPTTLEVGKKLMVEVFTS